MAATTEARSNPRSSIRNFAPRSGPQCWCSPRLILQVGARVLFVQAYIPGSGYVGPGEEDTGLKALRARVAKLPRETPIIIYCGCCPWNHCRNIGGAFAALQSLGFTDVKVLYLESDFGSNWVDRGYPVARGE